MTREIKCNVNVITNRVIRKIKCNDIVITNRMAREIRCNGIIITFDGSGQLIIWMLWNIYLLSMLHSIMAIPAIWII